MFLITSLGNSAISKWIYCRNVAAVLMSAVTVAAKRRHWPRTVREVLAKQVLFTGVDALRLVLMIACLTGVSIVAQAQVWLVKFGQSAMLGSVLCTMIVREIGPLIVNFVVIGRSGTAIATELANMRVRRELNVMEAQGVDPTEYVIMPRVIGMVLSVFCLSICFVAVALASGYVFGLVNGAAGPDAWRFLRKVVGAVSPADILNFLLKTTVPPALTAVICCMEGLGIKGMVTEVPQAATRSVVKSIAALIIISAIASLLTYA